MFIPLNTPIVPGGGECVCSDPEQVKENCGQNGMFAEEQIKEEERMIVTTEHKAPGPRQWSLPERSREQRFVLQHTTLDPS